MLRALFDSCTLHIQCCTTIQTTYFAYGHAKNPSSVRLQGHHLFAAQQTPPPWMHALLFCSLVAHCSCCLFSFLFWWRSCNIHRLNYSKDRRKERKNKETGERKKQRRLTCTMGKQGEQERYRPSQWTGRHTCGGRRGPGPRAQADRAGWLAR